MKETPNEPKRPISITIISILFFIAGATVLFWDLSTRSQGMNWWDMAYTELSAVIQMRCMVSLWKMKNGLIYLQRNCNRQSDCLISYGDVEYINLATAYKNLILLGKEYFENDLNEIQWAMG